MAHTKPAARHTPPKAARASKHPARRQRPASSRDTRLEECEEAIASLCADVETLRTEILLLRANLAGKSHRGRKGPPPLPSDDRDEVILVDEREIVLESIRPPRAHR